jgi:hypothetical protein
MDDNANKKKAHKFDSSNDVDPDPEQEGELPHPSTMEDKRAKRWIHIYSMLGIHHPLEGKFCEKFIKFLHFPPPGPNHGTPGLHSNYTASVTQSNITSSTTTTMKLACKVNSNDVDPNLDQNEGEIPNPFMEEERVKKSISSPLDGKFHESSIKSNSQEEVLNVSARHLAMLQVHRLAIFLTDENCIVCMYQYIFCCDTF